MVTIGKIVYGSWNDGSDIYKDKKGYYVVQYNPEADKEFKMYLKGWKPAPGAHIARIAGKTRKRRIAKRTKKTKRRN